MTSDGQNMRAVMQWPESAYLRFDEQPQERDRKTKRVWVWSRTHGDLLGEIRWWGSWRQYAFLPSSGTVWNPECMATINAAIKALMDERKAHRAC